MNLNDLIASAPENGGADRIDALKGHITAAHNVDTDTLENAAIDAFQAAYNDGDYSADDAPAMELLADIVDATRQAAQELATQQGSTTKNRVAELASRVGTKTTTENGTSNGENAEPVSARASRSSAGTEETDQDPEADEEGSEGRQGRESEGRPAHVNASRRTVSSQELNAHRSNQSFKSNAARSYNITAGADVPDQPQGKKLSMRELAEAAKTRMSAMPAGGQGEVRRSIGQINRNYSDAYTIDGLSPMEDAEKIDALSDERKLPGGSLVAAAQQEEDTLTASGMAWDTPPGDVWCSPSQTDFSLCEPLGERVGMVDLPSFTVRNGGVRYPVWKQFPEQRRPEEHGPGDQEVANDQAQGWWPTSMPPENYPYDAQYMSDGPRHDWHGYVHTNRNNIGSSPDLKDPDYFLKNPKKHIEGPCVEWAEERMNTAYLWITEDILKNHTWGALAERFMEDALLNHAHYMNEVYLKWIAAHSDRLDPFWAGSSGWGGPGDPPQNGIVPPGPQSYPLPVSTNNYYPGSALDVSSWGNFGMGSAAEAVVEKVGHLVTWFRNTYRMSQSRTMEGIAPMWFKEFLKLDIERKINRPHSFKVSDRDVEQAFRLWGCRMQWVYDWQDMPSTEYAPPYEDVRSQHVMPRQGWPNSVDILLYPSGSWVLAEQNIIRLDGAQYDHDRLRNNKYTSLFLEDAWMLLNRCNRSFIVQLRGLCANGATGAPNDACSSDVMPAQRERLTTTKDKIVKDSGGKGPSQGQGNSSSKKQADS